MQNLKLAIAAAIASVVVSATAGLAQRYAQLPPSTIKELDMSTIPRLNQDQVRQVQQALRKKGFPPGPIDGVVGPITREAVRRFQDRFAIKASGEIDNQTLFALGEADMAVQPGG